jgi:uncharacterized repeat protein (TIGR01451 family)
MKKRIGLIMILGLLGSLWIFGQAGADSEAFTFFIPYRADDLADEFRIDGQQPAGFTVNGVETIISISVLHSGSIIYYDQWEDGLEPNLVMPVQATTQVWGDNNPSNGSPPGLASDVLQSGDVIVLQNVVPVPRNPAVLFFDGGDKFISVGGAVAATLGVWPQPDAGILFGAAWEIYPTSRWDPNYVIPVGQNVPRPGGSFTTVGLNVQAVEDGTSVQLDLNADGTFEQTVVLNQGQQYPQVNGVLAGAQVQASAPVQVHVFTKDPASTWEARAYTMLPRDQWSNDYLAPRSSDGDYWLYNPNPNDLLVSVETVAGTTSITIPANSAGRFPPLPAPVLNVPTGAHFTASNDFYGVAALSVGEDRDWGYSLLPIGNLTTQALVGWAPGNNNNPPNGNESRVYVTAVTTTTVLVDYNNDGTPDASFPVSPLAQVDITAPNYNMTGARLYTTDGVPFIAVWGEDPSAPLGLPSLDMGTNIVPLRAPSIQKSYTLVQGGYQCNTVSRGYTTQFQLQVYNDSANVIPNAIVRDVLPTGFAYVPGSTTVRGVSIPDSSSGNPFPLSEGYNVGEITPFFNPNNLGSVISITYNAVIEGPGVYVNQAEIVSPPADPAIVNVTVPFRVEGYDVGKTLIDPSGGVVTPGQVITFDLTITNTGNVTITTLPLTDTFNTNYLTFHGASVPPDVPGEVAWTDLTSALGDLPPTRMVSVSVSFDVVDSIPSGVVSTTNIVLGEGVQDSEGRTQTIMCGEASVSFATPTPAPISTPTPTLTPTPTSTSTPTSTPKPKRTPEPTVTPQPPATPTAPPAPAPSPTPAVILLPETGVGYVKTRPLWPLITLPGLGFLVGWVIYRHLHK